MGKIFQYLELAIAMLNVIPTFIMLWTLKQPVTGTQVQADIQPALHALSGIIPKFQPDPVIVLDFCQSFADTFNKYVANPNALPPK